MRIKQQPKGSSPQKPRRFPLFGYPIAKSLAPAFQNEIFKCEGDADRYELWSTSKLDEKAVNFIKSDECGGAAITMPLKPAILQHLDEITPEARLTGAVNTVVKQRLSDGSVRLMGTNTDYLGIYTVLQSVGSSRQWAFSQESKSCAAVVGGGATTRSAILALHRLGLSPIFLVNRDEDEVSNTMKWFKSTEIGEDLELIHLENIQDVDKHLPVSDGVNHPPRLDVIVGAIPAILPSSYNERMVYTITSHLFTVSSNPPLSRASLQRGQRKVQPVFLDMAYYPRPTPLTQMAAGLGWTTIDGLAAMIEQGFAQQRMWRLGDASVEAGMKRDVLDIETEMKARELMMKSGDVKVIGVEVDRAYEDQ